ncbi:dienelactone hydrolase family protein [Denitratimonas tolerans]|jgi:dienelactone hydrolase
MHKTILLLATLFAASTVNAGMITRAVDWSVGEQSFSGHVVYDEGGARRPGLVMVPNWMGVTGSALEKARALAGSDYVVLVADVYGAQRRPADATEARAMVTALLGDRAVLRERIGAALEVLRANAFEAPLDAARIGAVGFCFGGSTVLELARSGADVAGVVSLHGGLGTNAPAAQSPKAAILVLNGADDRSVSAEDIAAFAAEMNAVEADWQFVNFAGAVHCFAEADAASPPGCVYHERSARRAYRYLHDFFAERFAP